ncbi:winged helix-turn-helix transcriptional regulator [Streptomyces sp. NPDC059690]|uniref:winged helix-turn-helix transcriptional regulator n=1 Tax=Streptomyces sp. NPDC059690 TaxID=3346907 RepID=UPI0036806855
MTHNSATFEDRLADRSTWRIGDNCPIAKALDVVGTRSAMLILREAFYGTTRFDDFAQRVEITEAVASARLRELTAAGILMRVPYQEPGQRTRHEYQLTPMGHDLAPAVIGLYDWGARYLSPGGEAPLLLTHQECGAPVQSELTCRDGHPVAMPEVIIRAGAKHKS